MSGYDPDEQNPEAVAGKFEVKDSGTKAQYADGMQRDTTEGKPRFDLLIPTGMPYEETLLYRTAMHYMLGGKKYGDRNWEKSQTTESLGHHQEALWRHFMKFVSEVEDGEDHAAAIVWNLNAVLYTRWRMEHELAKADAAAMSDDDIDDVSEAAWIKANPALTFYQLDAGARHISGPSEIPADNGANATADGFWQEFVVPIADPAYYGCNEKIIWAQDISQARRKITQWQAEVVRAHRAPKFGTPEFDAKFERVAAEQAKDWPKAQDGEVSTHPVPEDAANPSDDEVALAKSILERRAGFYDREVRELLIKGDGIHMEEDYR